MRKTNNTIEINGQRYDATTGKALAKGNSGSPPATAVTDRHHRPATKPALHDAARRPARHRQPHSPDTSHTLMRQAVKKPAPDRKHHLKAHDHTDMLIKEPTLSAVMPKSSVQQLDEQRLQHAKHITKSRLISHFSGAAVRAADPASAPFSVPRSAVPQTAPRSPAPTRPTGTRQKRSRTTSELLEHAVRQATSHKTAPPAEPRHSHTKRNLSIGSAMVLTGLVLGVIVMQNLSDVRLQVASAKAGFSASLPGYQPAGYSLGQLNYSNGVVAAQFHSNSDDRHYSLTQQRSSWDSPTLRDSFVAPRDPGYQTVMAGGRTIYLYNQNNATWVNGGIWYVIQSDGSLNDRQIIDLAGSL